MRAILRTFGKGIAASALVLALHACSKNPTAPDGKNPDPITTVSDGKPKKGLVGVLFDAGGSPLKGASVKAISQSDAALLKAATGSLTLADTVLTDSAGLFVFANLAKGTYNIQGDYGDGKLAVLIKDVKYGGDGILMELRSDTLRVPGKISGSLIFGEGNRGGISCSIPGTTYLALSDDSGSCTLSGIPPGSYTVAYSKDGFKTSLDTGVAVKSGSIDKLNAHEMEADPAYPPPPPSALMVAYDTLTGKATLRWHKVKVDDLAGYVIYRDLPSATVPTRLGSTLVKDSVYVDALYTAVLDPSDKEYTYRLKSQDATAVLSSEFSKPVTVKAASPTKVRTTFAWKTSGAKGDSASIGDSVTVSASWSNPSRKIVKLAFYFDAKTSPAKVKKDSALMGSDSLKVSSNKAGPRTVFAEATDEAGAAWWDSTSIRYVTDAPVADAGKDTTAPIHTLINFAASATQTFGTIVLYKWDFDGDGTYDDSSASGLTSHAYDHASAYVAKLLVRDDDGNEAYDFRNVSILNQAPVVKSVRADTTVSINDPITFTGSGSDTDGTVKGHAWDFDGNGTMDTSSAAAFSPIHLYAKIGVYNAVYRITDDDGLTAQRTVKITVVKDAPVANAGKDTTVTLKDIVHLHGSGTDKYGTIVAWAWDFGGTGTFKAVSKGDTDATAPAAPSAAWPCILRVTDDDGNISLDTVMVTVLKDAPTAYAGLDTTVSIGDAIHLSGKGTDLYGTVVERAWDVGATGTFRVTGSGDTAFLAPMVPAAVVCSLRVTDDDGNTTKDVMVVNVVRDAPVVSAGKDTTIAVGQSLTLTGTAKQDFGTIAMYMWDWQDNGSWDDSSATLPATTFPISLGGDRTVLFGARDDDGNLAVDTVIVHAVSYVGGTLSANTTFYKSFNPYILTSDLVVPAGVHLIMSAGVKISGPYTILVKGGSLTAVGIAADSVIMASPVRFEGSNLSGSQIGYARMSAAVALQIGNNGLGAGPAQNTGTLAVANATFSKNKVIAEAMASPDTLLLGHVVMDSVTLLGNGTGAVIDVEYAAFTNATVQASTANQGILLDSVTTENTAFLIGDNGATLTFLNSSLYSSSFKDGGGPSPQGPVNFTSCALTNTTVELPKTAVNFTNTTTNFSATFPMVKIGLGAIMKSKFTGAQTGTGLEITGYLGTGISGATTVDSSEVKDFDIGVLVRGFGTLSMTGTNFVNNLSYDLDNHSALGFNALDCYWSGSASTVNIDTRIRDFSDDASFGKVNFTTFVTIPYVF